jgi:pimeloyl-ACP methyl ester carboxylesterase
MQTNKDLDVYLIIGLTKESRHWSKDFIDEIKKVINPKEIVFVDLPGSGKYLKDKSPTNISDIVDFSRAKQTFNPNRSRMVIAISLGGMVAWNWVTRYPDDFQSFVMINSSMSGVSSVFKRVQPSAAIDFFKIAATKNGAEKEQLVLDLCSNNPENAKKILPSWTKLGVESSMHFSNILRQLIAGMNFKAKLVPKIPMLIIAAKHDRLAHYSCSQDIAKLVNAKFILCTDLLVGHAFHVDAPEYLVSEIKTWQEQSGI